MVCPPAGCQRHINTFLYIPEYDSLWHLTFTRRDMNGWCVVQWDRMLSMIGQTLGENGIPNVFVKGNVYVRNNAVMAFRVCMQCC